VTNPKVAIMGELLCRRRGLKRPLPAMPPDRVLVVSPIEKQKMLLQGVWSSGQAYVTRAERAGILYLACEPPKVKILLLM